MRKEDSMPGLEGGDRWGGTSARRARPCLGAGAKTLPRSLIAVVGMAALAGVARAQQEPAAGAVGAGGSLELGLAVAADYSPVHPTRAFPSRDTEVAAIVRLVPGERSERLTATWIAVDVGDAAPPGHVILTREQRLEGEQVGAFTFRTNASPPGSYRVEIAVDGEPWKSAAFEIVPAPEPASAAAGETLFPLAPGTRWTYAFVQEAGDAGRLDPPPGMTLDPDGAFRATMTQEVTAVDEAGARVELRRDGELVSAEWLRITDAGLIRTQREEGGQTIALEPPELLLPVPDSAAPREWEAPAYAYDLVYRMWGPLPVWGPGGEAPGYVTLATYPAPYDATVERHYLPGVGVVREVLITGREGRRISRQEMVLREKR